MISYFIFANLWALIFWIIYRVGFKNTQAFTPAKVFLMLGIIFSLTLPLVNFTFFNQWVFTTTIPANVDFQLLDEIVIGASSSESLVDLTLENVYVWIVIVGIVIYFWQLYYFKTRLNRFPTTLINGIKAKLNTDLGPGTFFNYMIFPTLQVDPAVLLHEKAHIQYNHYWQRLMLTLIRIVCFPVLVFYFYKKEWLLINEFQADASAYKECPDYPYQLINAVFSTKMFEPLQLFFHHPLKQRIAMITQSKRPQYLLATLLFFILTSTGFVLQAQNEKGSIVQPLTQKQSKKFTPPPTPPKAPPVPPQAVPAPPRIVSNEPKLAEKVPAQNNSGEHIDGDLVYKQVEQKAKYLGNMAQDLSNVIEYPDIDASEYLEGRVNVQFVIDKDGKMKNVKVLGKGLSQAYNDAAVNAVKQLDKWQPAMNEGRNVSSVFVQPISFKSPEPEPEEKK